MAFPISNFFVKGAVIGLSIAAPVGPIGVLVIRRTLEQGRRAGLACGLGAAVADSAYGCIAAFGLTAISNFLLARSYWLHLGGGIFLLYLGGRTMLRKVTPQEEQPGAGDLGSAFGSTLLLTLTNPMTILSFVAVFAGFGLAASASFGAAGTLVAGVFVGSALWWLFLTGAVSLLHQRVSERWMRMINRLSGGLIFAFGLYALWSLVE